VGNIMTSELQNEKQLQETMKLGNRLLFIRNELEEELQNIVSKIDKDNLALKEITVLLKKIKVVNTVLHVLGFRQARLSGEIEDMFTENCFEEDDGDDEPERFTGFHLTGYQ
jgi:hypothetical protein